MLALTNATVITGDGRTLLARATVLAADGRITGLRAGSGVPAGARVLDLEGDYLLPGFINSHVHGVTFGPLFASGAPPLAEEAIRRNLVRHLAAGTTTVLSVDGFALPEEVAEAQHLSPLTIKTSAGLTPAALTAAQAVDGAGLTERHLAASLKEQVEAGAVAIGEAGSGHTLGGGGSEYMYIPRRIKEETGVEISPAQARALKEAALGKELDPAARDEAALQAALAGAGLAGRLTPARAQALIAACVLPGLKPARRSIAEAAATARHFGLPLIAHTAPPSLAAVLAAARAGTRTIAAHTNHDSFTAGAMLAAARALKRAGAILDGATFDSFGARRTTESPANLVTLLKAGLVDLITTDYGGGFFDPLPLALKAIVGAGILPLPAAVRLLTAAPAAALPGLAPERGRIAPGYIADLTVLARADLARVRYVFIGGRQVFSSEVTSGITSSSDV
ncbi:MAG TPA: amidohydrolase family protein [Firmicutes bacterium]|nr:amidohydrolase family protein [Bacillota bacterium]